VTFLLPSTSRSPRAGRLAHAESCPCRAHHPRAGAGDPPGPGRHPGPWPAPHHRRSWGEATHAWPAEPQAEPDSW